MERQKLSVEEGPISEQEFEALLGFCQKLKAEGRLHSGVVYYVKTEDTTIAIKPVPPRDVPANEFPGGKKIPFETMAHTMLSGLQATRHYMSGLIDINSESWNESTIGEVLKDIESRFRTEFYRMEDYAKTGQDSYNVVTMVHLSNAAADLAQKLLSGQWLTRRIPMRTRMQILNDWADTFNIEDKKIRNMQLMSNIAELLIALNELRKLPEGKAKAESLIFDPKLKKSLVSFKGYFEGVASK